MLQRRTLIALGADLGLAALVMPGLLTVRNAHAAATVGLPAPDFALKDTAGQNVKLSQYKGKPVVLEWTNPGCPFVRKHYQGNMQALQKDYTQRGVVWLAINSTETASSDHLPPAELAQWMREKGASPSATLMDEDGTVGRLYGARTTPHMYIVNAQGQLAYAGGIDSIASARVADIEKATNHVRRGLDELLAGKTVSTPSTQPYGCSIKYKT